METNTYVSASSMLTVDLVMDKEGFTPSFILEQNPVKLNKGASLRLECQGDHAPQTISLFDNKTYKVVYDILDEQPFLIFSLDNEYECPVAFTEQLVKELVDADAIFTVLINPTEVIPVPQSQERFYQRPIGTLGRVILVIFYSSLVFFALLIATWLKTH